MRDDKANQAKYDDIKRQERQDSGTSRPDDRRNQDEYDVIQAKEEFESMLDPRTKALQERIEDLEHEVEGLKETQQ